MLAEAAFFTEVPQLEAVRSVTGGWAGGQVGTCWAHVRGMGTGGWAAAGERHVLLLKGSIRQRI